jgi:hypothetical protein
VRKQSNLEYWQKANVDLVTDLNKVGKKVTKDQVWAAIQIYCSEEFPDEIEFATDIFFLYVDYLILLEYLSNYDFDLNKIEFDTTTADIHYSLIYMVKAEVKHKGLIWVVHKNDADPFPSNPHAHEITNRFKMHLGNGKLYLKRIRVGKLKKSEFLSVREKLIAKGVGLPELEL